MAETASIPQGADVTVAQTSSKKALKLLKGTGIKKVEGINRVVLRKRGGVNFVIENPVVYRTPNGAYLVFGDAQLQQQDFAKQLAQLTGQDGAAAAPAEGADKSPEDITADLEEAVRSTKLDEPEIADEDVDTSGFDEDKISMIMDQANVSKAKAVNALKAHNGDLVNALMELAA